MIRLERLSKRYGDTMAVQDLSLEIPEGQLLALIGPSGCGKTTTLKMINRLIEPSGGAVYIGGKDVRHQQPEVLRRGIGYVIQSVGLFPHMSVRQNVAVVPSLLGWPKKRRLERADELLALVGLEPARYGDSFPRELSGGQQQRVGVARALAVDPPVLLMDEPFGAVDPLTRGRLQDEFLALQAKLRKTVVMVTHDLDEAIKLADRICLMNQGRLEQDATPEELLRAPANAFVRRFVGSDRALKRLSRVPVRDVMVSAPVLELPADGEAVAAALADHPTLYLSEGGRLVGWLGRRAYAQAPDVAQAMTPFEWREAVREDEDVREALSRLLGQGAASLPVVDAAGGVIGVLRLTDIVALTGEEGA